MTIESPLEELTGERRGALGDRVYSRNPYGPYDRARTAPTQSTSSRADLARTTLAELTARWKTLTPAQRTGWHIYANAIDWNTPINEGKRLQGDLHYIRCNIPRNILNSGYVDDPPTILHLPTFQVPQVECFLTPGGNPRIRVTVTDEPWTHQDGNQLYFSTRPALPGTHKYCPPGYFITGIFESEAPSPPTYTRTFVTSFTFTTGQRVPTTFRLSMLDGRLSRPLKILTTCT